MAVKGLDHITIITADLAETVRFYEHLLGFRLGGRPEGIGIAGGWLLDADDRPIIHLLAFDPVRHGAAERRSTPTGSIDHVAFACDDFAGTIGGARNSGSGTRSMTASMRACARSSSPIPTT